MVDIQLLGLLNATLQAATLLFIASLGELITEKSGILNLGVEGNDISRGSSRIYDCS